MMFNFRLFASLFAIGVLFSGCGSTIIDSIDTRNIALVKKDLDEGAVLNVHYDNGFTPLLKAAHNNDFDMVKYLTERGANVNQAGSIQGTSALHWATYYGNMQMVKYLIEKGAKVDVANYGNGSVLYWACTTNPIQYDIAKYLVSKGANPNFKFDGSLTYIMSDAQYPNYLDRVRCMVEAGTDVNLQSNLGDTALHWAAYKGNLDIVKYLISKGGQLDIKNNGGWNVAQVAIGDVKPYLATEHAKITQVKETEQIRAKVEALIAKQDFEGLKLLTEQNPNYVNYIANDELRLMLTGPKGMKVGDVRKLLKSGKSELIVVQLIKRVQTPYKEFSLDEIDLLTKMELTDKTIAAMIEVSTELLKDEKKRKEQENYLAEQKKASEQKSETKVIYQNNNSNNQNQSNDVVDALKNEAVKQLTNQLFKKLF